MPAAVAEVPVAFVDVDGEVVKLAPLRLSVVDGPGLRVTHGTDEVLLDGDPSDDEEVRKLSTGALSDEDGGSLSAEGLSVDPRSLGGGWAYEIKSEGRRIVWAPTATAFPGWADGADLVFMGDDGVAVPEGFSGRVVSAKDAGTSYLLRRPTMARLPVRRALGDVVKRLMGQQTYDERRELVSRALKARLGTDDTRWVYVRDMTDSWVAFDLSETGVQHPLYQAPYLIGEDGEVSFGEAVPIEAVTEYVLKRRWSAEGRRKALAAGHALPGKDGGPPRFPIENADDVRSAVRLARTGQERSHVIRQAKRVGATSLIPEGWTTTKQVDPRFESGSQWTPPGPAMTAVAGPVVKADEALRYTFAPLYPASSEAPDPSDLDAHGEFATAEDLREAMWDLVRKGDRSVRLQHLGPDFVVGERMDLVQWPYEVTLPLVQADGTAVEKTYQPGTVFMGVVWSDFGWEQVQKGGIQGYSLGGSAHRVDVEVSG